MKKLFFVLYTWGSTALFAMLILWLASIPNFRAGNNLNDDFVKLVFRIVIYAIFFILIYRSIIITLKSTVEKLAQYRSLSEKKEDSQFVLIIETIVIFLTMSICLSFAFLEEYTQLFTTGRNGAEYFIIENNGEFLSSDRISEVGGATYTNINSINEAGKDVLVSLISILLTSMVVYSLPEIGELEVSLKNRIKKYINKRK